ncbi:MAG: multiprotein bridging factor aMBF1 [Halobacteriaceae archaeon]
MVQCEMCGADTSSPTTVTVEGAELQVCDDCADFGTEVKTEDTSSTSTKYSTSSSDTSGGTAAAGGNSGGGGGGRRHDMFDEMEELAADYDERLREAREAAGLSQSELAEQLNLKASLIRKLEHGDTLPSDDVQQTLENALDVSLSSGASDEDTEWESDSAGDGLTLGDMVQRKD